MTALLSGADIARLIVISGPSGAGKGTLIQSLLSRTTGLAVSVSATTRPQRAGEKEGREYFFLTDAEFNRWIAVGRFLEWARYGGHLYGTPKQPVLELLAAGRDVILEIELEGARQVLDRCPDALMIFIMPPSLDELERRLRARNTENREAIAGRLALAKGEIEAVQTGTWPGRRQFDYVIVNDSVKRATDELALSIEQSREKNEQTDGR